MGRHFTYEEYRISVTNLSLGSLEPARIAGFHLLYRKVATSQLMRIRCEKINSHRNNLAFCRFYLSLIGKIVVTNPGTTF
jgi:hypothetical protein